MCIKELTLPILLLSPMLRKADKQVICFQLMTTRDVDITFKLDGYPCYSKKTTFCLGEYCFYHVINLISVTSNFPVDRKILYQLFIDNSEYDLSELAYGNERSPSLVIPKTLTQVLHGSCRNPHHFSDDSLFSADQLLQSHRDKGQLGPTLLLMSGDQIYADDVAGPMLMAIHALIKKLGIFKEKPLGIAIPEEIDDLLYKRRDLLPTSPWQSKSKLSLSYWLKKDEPHFTSLHAENHLIHFEEFIAYYLLVYSSKAWGILDLEYIKYKRDNTHLENKFNKQWAALCEFKNKIPSAERLFANVPTLMMFDDHDVTDDWNLTAQWEQNIASSPDSRRIIFNGMISYWLFQGLGNDAGEKTGYLIDLFQQSLNSGSWDFQQLDKSVRSFSNWHYCLDTQPKVVVLDTRTHRWRNEQNFKKPSGLMDFEMLMALQDELVNQEEVILVSPAPVFGVKSIEAIQAMFNFCGQPLLVDVENWMAHEGSAKKLLNIFRRSDTPKETIILSGDVHYSFCFSVQSRFGTHDNCIWQLTASGIKNEFPKKLINVLDKIDSFLYAPWSPLNFFTKRWQMEVKKHPLVSPKKQGYLVSNSAISLIELEDSKLKKYSLIHGDGSQSEFDLKNQN